MKLPALPWAQDLRPDMRAILLLLVTLGVSLRFREFLFLRSLWLDEIALIFQLKRTTYEQILYSGIKGNQGAPALFLLASKWTLRAITPLEVAARFIPLMAGCGFLFVSQALARQTLSDRWSQIVFMLLCATSPVLIYYSAEGKQYMVETFFASMLLLLFVRYHVGRTSLSTLAGMGAISVWCAHTAPVVLCGGGLVVMTHDLLRRRYRALIIMALVCSIWMASFGLHALTNLSSVIDNPQLRGYWGHGLAPWRNGVLAVVSWSYETWRNFIVYSLLPAPFAAENVGASSLWQELWGVILLLVACGGALTLAHKRSPVAPFLAAILTVAFGLALARVVPFSSRLILYLTPLVYLCCAAAVSGCCRGARARVASMVILVFLTVGPSITAATLRFIAPLDRNDMKGAIAALRAEYQPGEPIVVRRPDYQAFHIYSTRSGSDPSGSGPSGSAPSGSDPSGSGPFMVSERAWRMTPYRAMRDRLTTVILQSPTKSAWVISAFRSSEVVHALEELESDCCVVAKKDIGQGYVVARIGLRAGYQQPRYLKKHTPAP